MTVFKRGNVYWYNFKREGDYIQRSTKQGDLKAAREMEANHKTALAKDEVGIFERKKVPGFKGAMETFLDWSKGEHRDKPATYRRYLTSSVPLLRHFKSTHLDKISASEVEQYKTARLGQFKTARSKDGRKDTKKKIQPATVNRELACLRMVFNHAIKSKIDVENPVGKMGAKAFRENNEQTRVLSYDEEMKYLAAATSMLHDVAAMILDTGMRPEEVYRILPENVHLRQNYVFNPYGKTKAAKRRIELTARAKGILERRMKERKGKCLFAHDADADQPVPKVNNAHDRAVKKSKVAPFRLYDCRHTFATRGVESGIDLVTLAAMLGHSKINMVLRYAHPTQEHQTKAMNKMEQYVAEQRIAFAERNAATLSQAIQ